MLVQREISELKDMKKYPKELYFSGNMDILQKRKVSIVGSRKPSAYTKNMIQLISSALSRRDVCIISGGAMGVDAIAHRGAGASNTVAVLPCGIDIRYPSVNKNLLGDIEKNGLLLSQFQKTFHATPWSFVLRNELVVALGEVLVVGEADLNSGSMRSVEFAQKMGKKIYVLPHRMGESSGTNMLLKDAKAEAIYDIEEFASIFGDEVLEGSKTDEFLEFCKTSPSYDEALQKYPSRVFEAELYGEIIIKDARVYLAN